LPNGKTKRALQRAWAERTRKDVARGDGSGSKKKNKSGKKKNKDQGKPNGKAEVQDGSV